MKTILSIIVVVCCCIQLPAQAQAPALISYQGQLLDDQGQPLADGTYTLTFNIFGASAGGNPVWGPQVFDGAAVQGHGAKIPVTDGYFSLLLGPVDEDGDSIVTAFNGEARYLEITVEGDGPIAPRQQLVSAPFALSVADNAVGSDQIADGAIVNADIGNLDAGKLNTGTISENRLPQNAIDGSEIENNSIQSADIQDGTISSADILNNTISSTDILNNTISGADILDNTINTADIGKINVSELNGLKLQFDGGWNQEAAIQFARPNEPKHGAITYNNNNGEGMRFFAGAANGGNTIERMRIANNGRVGIGTTSPASPLEVAGAYADNAGQLSLRNSATEPTRMYLGAGTHGAVVGVVNTDAGEFGGIAFQTSTGASGATRMVVAANGNVGIGDTTPTEGALVVRGAAAYDVSNVFFWNGSIDGPRSVTGGSWSIYASSGVNASYYVNRSDARIKVIEGISDKGDDLSKLLKLEVTDYSFKDQVTRGPRTQKKLIAQQVEQIFPEVVFKSKDVVPDIYQVAKINEGWVDLDCGLKPGDRVRLLDKNDEDGIFEVLEARDGRFRTEFSTTDNEVFVYGREVDDFRSVDYEAVAMLNVSATQELHRQLQAKEKHIEDLERQLQLVKAEFEDENSRRNARLARVEQMISGLMNVSTTPLSQSAGTLNSDPAPVARD